MDIAATSSAAQQSLRASDAAAALQSAQDDENQDNLETKSTESDIPPAQRVAKEELEQSVQGVNGALETGSQALDNGAIGQHVDIRI